MNQLRVKSTAAMLVLATALAWPLVAQEPTPTADPAPESVPAPPAWIDGLKVFGLVRFRPQYESNYDFDKSTDDNREFVGSKIQIGVQKDFGDDVTAKIVLQDSRIWGGQPGSDTGLNTANSDTSESTDIREAYLHVKDLAGPLDLIAGRQILAFGDQRLVGHLDWTDVGRSFDGVRFVYNSDVFDSHLWGTVLAEEDSGPAGNDTAVGSSKSSGFTTTCDNTTGICTLRASTTQELDDAYFTGWYNTIKIGEVVHADLYYLGRHRKWKPNTAPVTFAPNATVATEDRRQDRDNLYTFGSSISNRTIEKEGRKVAPIPFDFSVEYAYQTGETGVRVNPKWDTAAVTVPVDPTLFNATNNTCEGSFQNGGCRIYTEKQRYDAYAYAIDLGFTIADFVRIGGEYDVASGDPDRTDGASATFDNLYHTNHSFYGEADQTSWRNMIARSGNLSFFFGRFGTLKLAYWEVDKFALQDSWYAVTGAAKSNATSESRANAKYGDITTASGGVSSTGVAYLRKHLFKEYDLTYNIKLKGILWGFGYSRIHAGDAIAEIKGDRRNFVWARNDRFDPTADFAYLMMTYKF